MRETYRTPQSERERTIATLMLVSHVERRFSRTSPIAEGDGGPGTGAVPQAWSRLGRTSWSPHPGRPAPRQPRTRGGPGKRQPVDVSRGTAPVPPRAHPCRGIWTPDPLQPAVGVARTMHPTRLVV